MPRLDLELVNRALCESRNEAQECIANGSVLLNGSIITKQSKNVDAADVLEVTRRRNFVSRGGEKLLGVLKDVFGQEEGIRSKISNTRVLDIGSSTGGFTDCLLYFGATHVDAVDVGKNQLHPKLRANQKVNLYEETDIRNFRGTNYDIIVADLSFISLESIFDTLASFGTKNSFYFLLIKPQFEVGKGNTKKGIVKDSSLFVPIFEKYKTLARSKNFLTVTIFPCIIKGGDGNQEFFLVCST